MTIAFDDVPNPFKRLAGVFEAHVTIAGSRDDAKRFGRWCDASRIKHVVIALPRGVCTLQPMTATYHRGGFADVRADVMALAGAIRTAGFSVSRVKIEATGANSGLPQTTREALMTPNNYFEFHLKVALRDSAERAALEAAVRPFGAHLSRNARSISEGFEQRFVTLRAYGVGQREAEAIFGALESAIRGLGLPVTNRLREFAVFDSNIDLDAGWLDASSTGAAA